MYPLINKEKTGQWLKCLLLLNNLQPKDIQTYLSLGCIQTVYRWLNGTNVPSVDHLYAMSSLLRIPMDRMVVGDKEEEDWCRKRELCLRLAGYLSYKNVIA